MKNHNERITLELKFHQTLRDKYTNSGRNEVAAIGLQQEDGESHGY